MMKIDLDLTAVTRSEMRSQITIRAISEEIRILAGEVDVRNVNNDRAWGRITARALDATDFEHDSAYVFQIPIVQVRFHSVHRGRTMIDALILGEEPDDLRLSLTPYDPAKLDGVEICKECAAPHPIVPAGFWAGPKTPSKLYEQLVGAKLSLTIYPPGEGE